MSCDTNAGRSIHTDNVTVYRRLLYFLTLYERGSRSNFGHSVPKAPIAIHVSVFERDADPAHTEVSHDKRIASRSGRGSPLLSVLARSRSRSVFSPSTRWPKFRTRGSGRSTAKCHPKRHLALSTKNNSWRTGQARQAGRM